MGYRAILLILFIGPHSAAAEITRLCNIEITADEKIDFTETEEQWLCGDPASNAWKTIPISQQRTFITSFLQSKGYHSPHIEAADGRLIVQAGEAHRVERFTVVGAPYEWNWAKKWGLKGRLLNPETLDEATGWAKRQLLERGFPCHAAEALAFTDTGEVRIQVDPGNPTSFGAIETVGDSGLDPAILDRFSAFKEGQTFDVRLLELTSARILREDLYLSTYFDVICQGNEPVRLVRRSVPALPRLFTIGAGFDTERGPLARARFRWSKIGPAANSLQATVFASFREQSLSSSFNYFFLNDLSSRIHLVPSLAVERLSEENFLTITTQVGTRLANSWEFGDFQLYADAGPVLERITTQEGFGPRRVNSVRLASKLMATSHLYEYYLSDPRQGWMGSLETSSQLGGIAAEQSIHSAHFQHQILWNLGRWDPPFLILGWRGSLASFFLNQRSLLVPDIAVSQRFFLGGDESIRGFSRKELPGSGLGFLTMLYQGFELRTRGWLPWNLQPFIFFDFAKGGVEAMNLDATNYYAGGFGLRYSSPIGTIRTSLGHGFLGNRAETDPEPGLRFFFSFGREF